ncbi:MAG: AMP-binding protein [Deltaproteobacteria bacterium]|nr:AMP-binding protein [Deltaproteobacteria bacterium]
MGLDDVKGMDIAQVIQYRGSHPGFRDRTFFIYYDEEGMLREVTFARFLKMSLDYAGMIYHLKERRDKGRDARFHVGFYMQNTPEVLYALGGCAFTNATLVGINNAQVGQRLAIDIKNMDVDVLFVDEVEQPKSGRTFLESVKEAHETYDLSALYPHFVIARKQQALHHPAPVATIAEMLEITAQEAFRPIPLDKDRAGVIIFTSGTTGFPKGIEVPWKKVFDVGVMSTTILNYTENDVSYVCMPLNHSNSLYLSVIPALLNGAKFLLRRRFSASNFVRDIERVGATVWNSVGDPVMYVLNTVGEAADYTHLPLRTVVSTGTNAHNRKAFTRIFGLDIFTEAFGSTEVGAIATVTPDTPEYCVGKYLPGKEIRIADEFTGAEMDLARVDETGRILNFDRAVGEIVVSQGSLGDSAFSGYYNMPEESAERVDEAGFYHMGDLGAAVEIEGSRFVIFLGRTGTDRLRSKGENFSTAFVEEIVLGYAGVVNCVVIGIPHFDSTENDNPIYIVEVERPAQFDVAGLYAFCRRNVPPYALPGFVRVVGELPKTDTQKVRKPVLLHEFIERTPARDADENDMIFSVKEGELQEFTTEAYRRAMGTCIDPTVRSRFVAVTKRDDLFHSRDG